MEKYDLTMSVDREQEEAIRDFFAQKNWNFEQIGNSEQSTMTTQSTMQTPEEMADHLLKSNQINTFIERYNKVSGLGNDKLRREKHAPHIYMIVVNKPPITIDGNKLLLVKVGFTHVSVERETGNRMENLLAMTKRVLEKEYEYSDDNKPDVSILFKFPINPIDTRLGHEVETSIRDKVGSSLPTEKAKEWGLPVPTEWILTTQKYIGKKKKEADDLKAKNEYISTKIFKSQKEDNKKCNLPAILGMTEEKFIEKLKASQFPLKKAESSASAKKATKKTMATPGKSQTVGESSTPEAGATQTPGKTSTTSASPGTPNMKDEEPIEEMFEELSLSPEKAESSVSAKKTTKKTPATKGKSQTAGESSTPEASATQAPGETSTTSASKNEAKTHGKKPSATDNTR